MPQPSPCYAYLLDVSVLAVRHPEVHVQPRIMAILSPRDLLKSVVRFDPRVPQILPFRTVHRGRRDPV